MLVVFMTCVHSVRLYNFDYVAKSIRMLHDTDVARVDIFRAGHARTFHSHEASND